MFGYVAPYKPEMKIREFELYKVYYCSLCHAMKKKGGIQYCIGLSYDLTSLAVLYGSMCQNVEDVIETRCTVNPLKKCRVFRESSREIEYTASLNIVLFYHKLCDDIRDEKKMVPWICKLVLSPPQRKNLFIKASQGSFISQSMKEFVACENNTNSSLEAAIHPYANMMAQLISDFTDDQFLRNCFKWLGYHLAKIICLIDAIDDFEQDVRHGVPNLLFRIVGYPDNKNKAEYLKRVPELRSEAHVQITPMLSYSFAQIQYVLRLLPIMKNQAIIENILIDGITYSLRKVIEGKGKKDESIRNSWSK